MDYLPDFLRAYLEKHYSEQIELLGQLNLSNAGGLYLYGMSFIMLFVPLAMIFFESFARSWKEKMEVKPAKPPSTKITDIRVYPIKSCRGFSLKSQKLLRTGLDLDRKWMFVDAEHMKYLTIRDISDMTLINTILTANDELSVSADKLESKAKFTIAAHPTEKWLKSNLELKKVNIWGRETDAWIYPTEMTAPFKSIFGRDVLLALKGPQPRTLGSNGHEKHLGRVESTLFPDMAPVLVASEASLKELNRRLKGKGEDAITIERFRPNIIVEGTKAWEEDVWKTVQLGEDIVLDVTARCARCQVPNVEPNTGEKHKKEPWTTLMDYRRVDEGMRYKPCFGMLCAAREEGEVHVGMELSASDTTAFHRYIAGFS